MIATKDGLELSNCAHVINEIWLDDIQTEGTQSRAGINERTVSEYAELMEAGTQMPPVVVFSDGERYWLGDGFHRLAAAKKVETGVIPCEVRQGTIRDALRFSLGSNCEHGLRRSNADKRHAVELALKDEEWSTWSNVRLAELCGVSDKLVAKIWLELSGSNGSSLETAKRIGADGKSYPAANPRPTVSQDAEDPDFSYPADADEFDTAKLNAEIKREKAAKEPKSGTPIDDSLLIEHTLTNVSKLVRQLKVLDLLEKHGESMNAIIGDVKAKAGMKQLPVAAPKPVEAPLTGPLPF